MAGEAPRLHPEEGTFRRWLAEGSDAGLAIAMLLLAAVIVGGLFLVDRSLLW